MASLPGNLGIDVPVQHQPCFLPHRAIRRALRRRRRREVPRPRYVGLGFEMSQVQYINRYYSPLERLLTWRARAPCLLAGNALPGLWYYRGTVQGFKEGVETVEYLLGRALLQYPSIHLHWWRRQLTSYSTVPY